MMKEVAQLDFFHLDTHPNRLEHSDKVDRAFWFWKKSWEETFKQLGVEKKSEMTSDEFLHKKMLALFDGDEPVGLIFYTEVNISKECVLEHSYFKHYTDNCLEFVRGRFKKVFILSHISVHSDYRKKRTNIPISELMFSLGVKAFQRTRCDIMLGYIRYEIKDIFYRHGAIKIESGHQNNIEVDYCYVTQESVKQTIVPLVDKVATWLWTNKNKRGIYGNNNKFRNGEKTNGSSVPSGRERELGG